MRKAVQKPTVQKPFPKIPHDVVGQCPFCACKIGLPAAVLGEELKPVAVSDYFSRLRKAESLMVEIAGAGVALRRLKRKLGCWLTDTGFIDSAL